jgi:hypothetical protein
MEARESVNRPFEDVLRGIPSTHLDPRARNRMLKLTRGLDNVGRLDERTGEVFVDERSLRRVLDDRDLFPSGFGDAAITELKNSPDSKLLSDGGPGKKTVGWYEMANHLDPIEPTTDTYESLGLNAASTKDDVRNAVKRRFPNIPEQAFDEQEGKRRLDRIVTARSNTEASDAAVVEAVPDVAAVWSCVRRRLGWWASFSIIWTIAAMLATWPNWPLGLAIAGIGVGGSLLVIILNCIWSLIF